MRGISAGIRRSHLRGGSARFDGHGLRVVASPIIDGGVLRWRDGVRRGLGVRVVLHPAMRGQGEHGVVAAAVERHCWAGRRRSIGFFVFGGFAWIVKGVGYGLIPDEKGAVSP